MQAGGLAGTATTVSTTAAFQAPIESSPSCSRSRSGDLFPWTPDANDGFIVKAVEPERLLVLGGDAGTLYRATWAFVLEPIDTLLSEGLGTPFQIQELPPLHREVNGMSGKAQPQANPSALVVGTGAGEQASVGVVERPIRSGVSLV